MHLLYIPKWYPNWDDPQLGIFIQKHAEAVAQQHRVTVLYIYGHTHIEKPDITYEEEQIDNLKTIKVYFKKQPPTNAIMRSYNLRKYYSVAKQAIKKYTQLIKGIDWVHFHVMGRNLLLHNYLRKITDYKIAITEHQTAMANANVQFEFWRTGIYKSYAQKAAFITTVSVGLQQAMQKRGLVGNYKIVPNVVKNPLKKINRNDGQIRFLNVSDMFDAKKNVSGIINAFAELHRNYPNTELSLIGDGPDFEHIKALANSKNLGEKIKILGRLNNPDVLAQMQQHDIYITNSNLETFSVATAEAAMAGLPVIATRCGGPETFVTPTIGLLIERQNHNDLLNAMRQMLQSRHSYDAQAMRTEMENQFGAASIAQQFSELYKKY